MAKYWLRQKSFGYGATSNTWQGGVLTTVTCAALLGVVLLGPAIGDNGLHVIWMVLGSAAVLVPTCLLAYVKTEGGWRWRSSSDD